MSGVEDYPPAGEPDGLRALYNDSLEAYLKAQDAQVVSTLRTRWLVLVGGLTLSVGIMVLAGRSGSQAEVLPMIAFGLAVGAIGLFVIMKDSLGDMVRDEVMARIAKYLGLQFDKWGKGFDVDRFEILGLAHCTNVMRHDRLYGKTAGLGMDMVTAKLTDESTSGVGNAAQAHTSVWFTGLLMRIDDPAPPTARFRLIPPAAASSHGMLRGTSVTLHGAAGPSRPSKADFRAMLAATPEGAPVTPTGDPRFDARFELHVPVPDTAVALARLDAGTRSALLDIADLFGGGAVSVGFDAGGILFAFVTKQRFEIGRLRPPMAQFERVRHLADQMGVLSMITERIKTARDVDASPS
jgi:hypothetical protein